MGWHRITRWGGVLLLGLMVTAVRAEDEAKLLADAQTAVEQGRFTDAEQMLRAALPDPNAPVVSPPAVALEIIRRIRLDYALTPEALLEKLRARLPSVTADDLERWRQQGGLQYRMIDGAVRYFVREPGNLFRFCEEAKSRRKPEPAPTGYEFDLPRHIAGLVAAAKDATDPMIRPVRHHVRYELCVNANHPRVHAGAQVRCWLPFPQEYRQQRDVRLISTDPPGATIAPNGCPQRTLYFEQTITDPNTPPRFAAEFEFVTAAYCPQLDPAQVKPYDTSSDLYREYTAERPPHIVFTPDLKRTADEIVGDETNPLLRARRIFRWLDANVKYCAEMEYGTIANISDKAFTTRRGDCGVQGLLFMTLCRAAGIPARWQSGWESLPNGSNMHDWAEFYVEPWGWLPADPSYGVQKHADPQVQDFYCGHMDAYRMIVNLDYARELHPPKASFRSEPNDFQRGEIEIDGHNLYYNEWDWTFDVQTTPLEGGLAALEETLDAFVPAVLAKGKMSGAVIAVGRKMDTGFETWQKAYGFQRTEPARVPMTTDAIFDLASMTKPIATGTSLMILIEEGRVGLDDPVGKYLPEFNAGDKQGVTVRHLMTHMSGLPPYVDASQQKVIKEKAGFPCRAEMRAYIRNLELARPPGKTVVYSCLNAILCGELVEVVSGMPLDRFAAERVFRPLKMTDSGYNPPEQLRPRIVPTTRTDYGAGDGGFLQGQVHDPLAAMQAGVSGNAGLFSTVGDLARFAQMILNGGELDGVRILEGQTVHDMTHVQNPDGVNAKGVPDRRGLLWDIYAPDRGDQGVDALYAVGHTGYTGTAIRFYPEQGVYVIVLANRVHPDDSGKVDALRRQTWNAVGQVLMNVSTPAKTNE